MTNLYAFNKSVQRLCQTLLLACLFFAGSAFSATPAHDSANVIQSFTSNQKAEMVESFDKTRERHQILFIMGAILLVLILVTAGLGISMVMLGKKVFLQHMIFAGLTVFLSVAHAVASVVWFFPYK